MDDRKIVEELNRKNEMKDIKKAQISFSVKKNPLFHLEEARPNVKA